MLIIDENIPLFVFLISFVLSESLYLLLNVAGMINTSKSASLSVLIEKALAQFLGTILHSATDQPKKSGQSRILAIWLN